MKTSLKFVLSAVLAAFGLFGFFPICADAQNPKNILVTDITGQKEKVVYPEFHYSETHENNMHNFFEVVVRDSPRKSVWFHFTQMRSATFEPAKKGVKIAIIAENGETFTGIFPESRLKISGEGELGKATYDLAKIRSIEFVEFAKYEKNKEISINQQVASQEWKKSRKAVPGAVSMTVSDGNTSIKAENLEIQDCYNTNVSGFTIYYGKSFRRGDLSNTITVQRGSSEVEVPLKDLESFEITGKKVDNRPEVILAKKDGKKFTVGLLMRVFTGEKNVTYGAPEPDDMLVWNSEHGFEGISLFPLRPMILKAQK